MSNGAAPPPAPTINVTTLVIGSAIGTVVGGVVNQLLSHLSAVAQHHTHRTSVREYERRRGR